VNTSAVDEEAILFWHRCPWITDIAFGERLLVKAPDRGVGMPLAYR
jgi:hypothetical protein